MGGGFQGNGQLWVVDIVILYYPHIGLHMIEHIIVILISYKTSYQRWSALYLGAYVIFADCIQCTTF